MKLKTQNSTQKPKREGNSKDYIPRIFEVQDPEQREKEIAKLERKINKREFFLEPLLNIDEIDLNDPYMPPLETASFIVGLLLDSFNRNTYTIFSALFDQLYLRKQNGEFIKEKEIIKTLEGITVKNIVKTKDHDLFFETTFNFYDEYAGTGFAKSFNLTGMKLYHLVELPGTRLFKFFTKSYTESVGWYRLDFRNKLMENIYLAKDPNWVKPPYFPYPSQEHYDAKQREWNDRKKKVKESAANIENGAENEGV